MDVETGDSRCQRQCVRFVSVCCDSTKIDSRIESKRGKLPSSRSDTRSLSNLFRSISLIAALPMHGNFNFRFPRKSSFLLLVSIAPEETLFNECECIYTHMEIDHISSVRIHKWGNGHCSRFAGMCGLSQICYAQRRSSNWFASNVFVRICHVRFSIW